MAEIFIVDEWLWSDLNGDNGKEKQKETFSFLEALYKRCDKIAVAISSKFQQKEWNFSKNAIDSIKRGIARFYFYYIRCNYLKYEGVDIEEEVAVLENINLDDVYLIKTHYKTKAPIITTDNKLINALQSKNIPCKHRDQFLQEYLGEIIFALNGGV